MYHANVFKSLTFAAGGHRPDRREPAVAPDMASGARQGVVESMPEGFEMNETRGGRGLLLAGLVLAALFGVVLLKAGSDPGGELDD